MEGKPGDSGLNVPIIPSLTLRAFIGAWGADTLTIKALGGSQGTPRSRRHSVFLVGRPKLN